MELTRRDILKTAASTTIGAVFVSQTGCAGGVTEVTLALGLVETAAQEFVQVLAPQDVALLSFATQIANEIPPTIKELASSDSAAVKYGDILGYFQPILASVIPAGTFYTLGEDLLTDIKNFLAVLNPAPVSLPAAQEARAKVVTRASAKLLALATQVQTAPATKPWDGKLTSGDKKALVKIGDANVQVLAEIKAKSK